MSRFELEIGKLDRINHKGNEKHKEPKNQIETALSSIIH